MRKKEKSTLAVISIGLTLLSHAATPAMRPQLMAYRSFQKELAETAEFAKLGVNLRAFGICNTMNALGKPYSDYGLVWQGIGKYDWTPIDEMIGDILKVNPDAKLFCLLDLNTPFWLTRNLHIDSFEYISHTAAMPNWRNETRRYLKDLATYVNGKYGDRIVAYSLMAGRTTEWFEDGQPVYGSVAKDAAWRAWCKARGVSHGDGVPTKDAMRKGSFEGVIFDPATESAKIDYWRFHNGVIADAVLDFAHVLRGIVGDEKQIGAFFGYYFICNKNMGSVGHLDYERLAASPDIDFFSSPATYTERQCGFGTGSMAVNGTLRLHGKRVVHEIDFWPDTRTPPWGNSSWIYWRTPEETVAGNTREAAFALVNGTSFWWFDMWGKMYTNHEVRRRIAKFAEIQKRFQGDLPPPEAEVLVVADPDSAMAMADPGARCPDGFVPSLGCGETTRNALSRTGVVYDTCSFNDLAKIDLSRVKVVVLGASWVITPEKAKILRDFVCRNNRTVVWSYAPGVSDGKTLDAKRVKSWAGVPFKTRGVTVTEMGGWKAAYAYDYRELTPEKFRAIEKDAGCFFYTDELLPVACNGRLLAIHVGKGGTKTIRLPRKVAAVVDLMSGETVSRDTTEFSATFGSPDTKIYELRPCAESRIFDADLFAQVPVHSFNDQNKAQYLADIRAAGISGVLVSTLDVYSFGAERAAHYAKVANEIRYFEAAGLPVMVWTDTLGYGNSRTTKPDGKKRFANAQPMVGVAGGSNGALCPLDGAMQAFAIETLHDIARTGTKAILIDDDFVQSARGRLGCACPLHLKRVSEKLGRPVSRDEIMKSFTGAPNPVRTAFVDTTGDVAIEFARLMRKAVDEINPKIEMGLCLSYTHWDIEGADMEALLTALAAKGQRLFVRLSGAPYWSDRRFAGAGLEGIIEFVRMQAEWTRHTPWKVLDENDPYPRKVAQVPAWRCEIYDKAIIADGISARHKYMLNYGANRDEPGYLEAHLANLSDDAKLKAIFANTEAYGITVPFPKRQIREMTLPKTFNEGWLSDIGSFPRAAALMVQCGLPVRYDACKTAPTLNLGQLQIDAWNVNYKNTSLASIRAKILAAAETEGRPIEVSLEPTSPRLYPLVRKNQQTKAFCALIANCGENAARIRLTTKGKPQILSALRGVFAVEAKGLTLDSLAPHEWCAIQFKIEP